jgi:hypothetical protein
MDAQVAKKEAPKREPSAVFDIPAGLVNANLGIESNRTINDWALSRVLAYLGAHSVDIVDSVAMSNDGKYCELVRDGDTLVLFDKL